MAMNFFIYRAKNKTVKQKLKYKSENVATHIKIISKIQIL